MYRNLWSFYIDMLLTNPLISYWRHSLKTISKSFVRAIYWWLPPIMPFWAILEGDALKNQKLNIAYIFAIKTCLMLKVSLFHRIITNCKHMRQEMHFWGCVQFANHHQNRTKILVLTPTYSRSSKILCNYSILSIFCMQISKEP